MKLETYPEENEFVKNDHRTVSVKGVSPALEAAHQFSC